MGHDGTPLISHNWRFRLRDDNDPDLRYGVHGVPICTYLRSTGRCVEAPGVSYPALGTNDQHWLRRAVLLALLFNDKRSCRVGDSPVSDLARRYLPSTKYLRVGGAADGIVCLWRSTWLDGHRLASAATDGHRRYRPIASTQKDTSYSYFVGATVICLSAHTQVFLYSSLHPLLSAYMYVRCVLAG